jgi:hypothetical protein
VRICRVSKLLPHQPVATLACPKNTKPLGLMTRTFYGEFLDRHSEFVKAGSALAYYACRYRCPVSMQLAAFLGYDGPVKMWVDGVEVFCDLSGTTPAHTDTATVRINGAAGEHEALVALDTDHGDAWGIFLRFATVDADGKRVESEHWPEMLDSQDAEAAVSSMSERSVAKKRKTDG